MSGLRPFETVAPRAQALTWLALALPLLALGPVPASAQGLYLGASAVWLDPGDRLSRLSDSGFLLVGGYEVGDLAGVEVGYLDWSGPVTHDDPYLHEELELSAFSLAAVGRLALESGITPYAKAGWLFWEVDGVIASEDLFLHDRFEYSRSGADLFLAVGVAADLGRGLSAYGELAMYEVDVRVIHALGLGLRVHL